MSRKPLKIAQVTNLLESIPPRHKAGLEQMVYYLTEELVKAGHDVTVFGTADSQTSAKLVPIWPVGLTNDPQTVIRDPQTFAVWAVSEAFSHADEFDIIHDHTYHIAGHFAGSIKTPVVTTMHHPVEFNSLLAQLPDSHAEYIRHFDKNHYTKAHTVVVSNFQKQRMEAEMQRSATVIHNGIPVNEWSEWKEKQGDYLAFLGYISGPKGAAEAIAATLKTDEKLLIAGPVDLHDHASQEYFKEKIEPFLEHPNIEWVGPLNKQEKQSFLASAKATLMPIQWDEPFGLVAFESMIMGTPVIAWIRASMPEIIQDGVNGFLVNSIDEMADRIKRVNELSRQSARNRVVENFSADKMAQSYIDLYYQIVESHT